jgi:AcrR family transcriptional regulator
LSQEAEDWISGQGLRARGKRERRRRLREAARTVFLERGYDGATTREIAARADIAIGTLFAYAPEKRDLLFMIINDDLDAIVQEAARNLAHDQPLIQQLLTVFRPFYKYFEQNVAIGRYGIHEIFLFQDEQPKALGPEAKRVADRSERTRQVLVEILERLKSEGRLSTRESGQAMARVLLWIHWCHVQSWLAGKAPRAETGVKGLRSHFSMIIRGLGPKPGEV